MLRRALLAFVLSAGSVLAQVVSYEGDSFPEEHDGWFRIIQPYQGDRWLEDGWLVQHVEIAVPGPPEEGERDAYRRNIEDLAGVPTWFLEWRMVTDGPEDFWAVAPACIAAAGQSGVWYHFTIAWDQVRFHRDTHIPNVFTYFSDLKDPRGREDPEEPSPHVFRLELEGGAWYAYFIDDIEIDSGLPEDTYPTDDSFVIFRDKASTEANTARWDYIRFGLIPQPGSGDYNSDGQVGAEDFYFFTQYYSGPGVYAGRGAAFADFDFDGDVDCDDYAAFEDAWTEPDNPPFFAPCAENAIPTVSQSALVAMALVTLTAATAVFRKRRGASVLET